MDRAHRVLKNIHRSDLVDAAGVRTPLAHLHHILVGACVSVPTSPPPVGCPIDSNEAASLHLRVLRCERSETTFVCNDGGSFNRYARPTPSLRAAHRQHNARNRHRCDVLRGKEKRPARSFSYVKLMFYLIPFPARPRVFTRFRPAGGTSPRPAGRVRGVPGSTCRDGGTAPWRHTAAVRSLAPSNPHLSKGTASNVSGASCPCTPHRPAAREGGLGGIGGEDLCMADDGLEA